VLLSSCGRIVCLGKQILQGIVRWHRGAERIL
jgi:hypothetical protein